MIILNKKKYLIFLLSFIILIIGAGCSNKNENKQIIIKKYEVVSVNQYIKNETNKFGGIENTNIYYTFTYIDDNNDLVQIDEFSKRYIGKKDIRLGNKNEYVIKENCNDDYVNILYLTKETLNNLKLK